MCSDKLPPARIQLSPAGQKVLAQCLSCRHLAAELPGEIPSLYCAAPRWHCHRTGHRAKLRQLLREIAEAEKTEIEEG